MKKITLAIIGNIHPEKVKFAIDTSTKAIENHIEDVYVKADQTFSIDTYSDFCLKELINHIKTDFVMIVQYDGMAVKSNFWKDDFFNYDYIGASWPSRFTWISDSENVGNGGFSLRSMKLLTALKDDTIQRKRNDIRFDYEDAAICLGYRKYLMENHDIKFAPKNVADTFSHEWCNPTGNSLGFHGIWNTPLFFDEDVVIDLVKDIPATYWYADRFEMFKEMCNNKRYFQAKMLVVNKLMEHLSNK